MVTREQDLDCQSNSCRFGGRGKGGMRTNGRCTCIDRLIDQINDLEAALKAKDATIQELSELTDRQQQRIEKLVKRVQNLQGWYDKMFGTPCEEIRHAQQLEELEEKYNTLMQQAVRFAEMANFLDEANAFLDRPEVQARRKEQHGK